MNGLRYNAAGGALAGVLRGIEKAKSRDQELQHRKDLLKLEQDKIKLMEREMELGAETARQKGLFEALTPKVVGKGGGIYTQGRGFETMPEPPELRELDGRLIRVGPRGPAEEVYSGKGKFIKEIPFGGKVGLLFQSPEGDFYMEEKDVTLEPGEREKLDFEATKSRVDVALDTLSQLAQYTGAKELLAAAMEAGAARSTGELEAAMAKIMSAVGDITFPDEPTKMLYETAIGILQETLGQPKQVSTPSPVNKKYTIKEVK